MPCRLSLLLVVSVAEAGLKGFWLVVKAVVVNEDDDDGGGGGMDALRCCCCCESALSLLLLSEVSTRPKISAAKAETGCDRPLLRVCRVGRFIFGKEGGKVF